MKLTIFPSDKGDCLLLTSAGNHHILVDGGMKQSYTDHVSPVLDKLCGGDGKDQRGTLDVIYVSHIDNDHIAGVLQLVDDELEWQQHEHQNLRKKPKCRRPPQIKEIWHNGFGAQIRSKELNSKDIEENLTASAAILSGSDHEEILEFASQQRELATGISYANQLMELGSDGLLGIKFNRSQDANKKGKLMMVRTKAKSEPISFGAMNLHIVGPFKGDLEKLREEWKAWLEERENAVGQSASLSSAKKGELQFGTSEINDILLPRLSQADALSQLLSLSDLGDRNKVTTPNLASLMFFVEEKGQTLLLTGDGHGNDILKGLDHIGKVDVKKDGKGDIVNIEKGLHVNILKVQHHGSEYNIDEAFCRAITADHYVFCGDGSHENPNLNALQAIFDSRRGTQDQRSSNAKDDVSKPFTFWFNSHSSWFDNSEAGKNTMKDSGTNKKEVITPKQQMDLIERRCREFKSKDKTFNYVFLGKETTRRYLEIELQ